MKQYTPLDVELSLWYHIVIAPYKFLRELLSVVTTPQNLLATRIPQIQGVCQFCCQFVLVAFCRTAANNISLEVVAWKEIAQLL